MIASILFIPLLILALHLFTTRIHMAHECEYPSQQIVACDFCGDKPAHYDDGDWTCIDCNEACYTVIYHP